MGKENFLEGAFPLLSIMEKCFNCKVQIVNFGRGGSELISLAENRLRTWLQGRPQVTRMEEDGGDEPLRYKECQGGLKVRGIFWKLVHEVMLGCGVPLW